MRERVFRRLDSGWVRKGTGYTPMGDAVWVHVTGQDDETRDHPGQSDYHPDCGWCYLGAAHSQGAHSARVRRFG